jgi:flavin reductase (DIM6/NTAB) family NADH-FMN oxidoreductase RutF
VSNLSERIVERQAARELDRVADDLEERAADLGAPWLAEAAADLRCRAIDLRERPEQLAAREAGQ